MNLVTYDDGTNNKIAGFLTPDEIGVVPLASIDPSVTSLQTFIEVAEGGAMARVNAQLENTNGHATHPCASAAAGIRACLPILQS